MPSPPRAKSKLAIVLPWLLFVAWAIVVLWASLDARPFRPLLRILSWDKLQHAGAYALLTLFCGLALRTLVHQRPVRCWLAALSFSFCYGAVVEVLQHTMTRSRRGEPLDLLADLVGGLLIVAIAIPLEIKARA